MGSKEPRSSLPPSSLLYSHPSLPSASLPAGEITVPRSPEAIQWLLLSTRQGANSLPLDTRTSRTGLASPCQPHLLLLPVHSEPKPQHTCAQTALAYRLLCCLGALLLPLPSHGASFACNTTPSSLYLESSAHPSRLGCGLLFDSSLMLPSNVRCPLSHRLPWSLLCSQSIFSDTGTSYLHVCLPSWSVSLRSGRNSAPFVLCPQNLAQWTACTSPRASSETGQRRVERTSDARGIHL